MPVCPAAARLSSQRPEVVESTANPENVWKSSLSWHTSEDTCQQNIISYQGVLCRHLVEGEGAGGGAGGGVGAGVARVPDVGGVGRDGGAAGGGGDEACTHNTIITRYTRDPAGRVNSQHTPKPTAQLHTVRGTAACRALRANDDSDIRGHKRCLDSRYVDKGYLDV